MLPLFGLLLGTVQASGCDFRENGRRPQVKMHRVVGRVTDTRHAHNFAVAAETKDATTSSSVTFARPSLFFNFMRLLLRDTEIVRIRTMVHTALRATTGQKVGLKGP